MQPRCLQVTVCKSYPILSAAAMPTSSCLQMPYLLVHTAHKRTLPVCRPIIQQCPAKDMKQSDKKERFNYLCGLCMMQLKDMKGKHNKNCNIFAIYITFE